MQWFGIALACAFIAGAVGERRGSTWAGFFLGLIFGPLGVAGRSR
jgi:hypothetical protein